MVRFSITPLFLITGSGTSALQTSPHELPGNASMKKGYQVTMKEPVIVDGCTSHLKKYVPGWEGALKV